MAMLVGFIVLLILITLGWRAVRAAVALDKGDADTAFRTALCSQMTSAVTDC